MQVTKEACLRQGAQCVYSSSLPKGRPTTYRSADIPIPPSKPSAAPSVTPELRRQHPASSHTATAAANANASIDDDAIMAGAMDTLTPNSTWPWLEEFKWDTIPANGSEQDPSQWASNSHTNVGPQLDAGAEFLDPFPSLQGWAPTGDIDGDDSARRVASSPTRLHEHGQGLGGDLNERSKSRGSRSRSRSSSSSSSSSGIITNKNGPDVGIARLSQLSTRLYPLYRSSCTLAKIARLSAQSSDRNQAHQSPLLDDAAFKSVSEWLVQVSANMTLSSRTDRRDPALETTTTSDTLHDVFSASHHLLEILRCLQIDLKGGSSSSISTDSTSTRGAHLDLWASTNPHSAQATSNSDEDTSYFERRKVSSSYPPPSSQYSHTVVRHLVIACHTLLLNIHVAVLIALQHDALRWTSYCSAGNIDADTRADAAALADIRPVLAVQLCSYLIERQHQAVDLYLSLQSPAPSLQQHDLSSSQHPSQPAPTIVNREVMSDLRMEVQQRLEQLRQTLRI
ncbi:MAG: hypothetical protein ASARMPRED_001308 [Alectoria sarmentosa]|nr:MAG: hypothetical protein ASARMPRED_001308 [Alectoria sarmentosa]